LRFESIQSQVEGYGIESQVFFTVAFKITHGILIHLVIAHDA
jgi:hypothetical protein